MRVGFRNCSDAPGNITLLYLLELDEQTRKQSPRNRTQFSFPPPLIPPLTPPPTMPLLPPPKPNPAQPFPPIATHPTALLSPQCSLVGTCPVTLDANAVVQLRAKVITYFGPVVVGT